VRAKPGGGPEVGRRSAYAPVVRCPLASCLCCRDFDKKQGKLICEPLRMQVCFFRRAVRAESTRALLTWATEMMAVLVNLLIC